MKMLFSGVQTMDEPSEDEVMLEYFKHYASRRRMVLIGECELDENDCWDMLLHYGSIEEIQLTSDGRAAFVDFACEHAPLLAARCFAHNRFNPLVPFPNGVDTCLPGCSLNTFLMLHNVPPELSTLALHRYFSEWSREEVKVYRPGPVDRPSFRAVVELPVRAGEFLNEGLMVMVQVNGRQHCCFAIPPLEVLTDVSGVLTMDGCDECNVSALRSTMKSEQRKHDRDMERLADRDADLARQLHPVDDGYVSPDASMLVDQDPPHPIVPRRRPQSLDIPEERVPTPPPMQFNPAVPEFVRSTQRPLARVIPEQRVPLFVPNDAPKLPPSFLDGPTVAAPVPPLLPVAVEKKSPEVQRNDKRVTWHTVPMPPPAAYSSPYVARPMLPRPIPKEEKWDDVPSVSEDVKVDTKLREPSPRPPTNIFLTPSLPRLDAGESVFPPELLPKPLPPITAPKDRKKKKKRKGSNTDELPVVSNALTTSTALASLNDENNDNVPPVTLTNDKSMEYSNQARPSPIPVMSLSIVEPSHTSFRSGQDRKDGVLEFAPCNELSLIRPEDQEPWMRSPLCTLPITQRWDDLPKKNNGQVEYDNQDHTSGNGFGFGRRAPSENRQIEEINDAGKGFILSSAPITIETSEKVEREKKEVELRDRSYSVDSTISCQSRTASQDGIGLEEDEGDDVSSLLSSTCLSVSDLESEDEGGREMEDGGGKEEEVQQRALADFPTVRYVFDANENEEEEEQRAAVDFPTANNVFDATENAKEKEKEEQRATVDFPTANVLDASENAKEEEEEEQRAVVDFTTAIDAFDASENSKEKEEEEHRAAVDFPTANDVFDASENAKEEEEEEQRAVVDFTTAIDAFDASENSKEKEEEEHRAAVDFPTANDVFDASENAKEEEEEEQRAVVDFTTAIDAFDASENSKEKEEEEHRDLPLDAPCVTRLSMMMSRVGSEEGKEEEGDQGEDAVDGRQRDSKLSCVEEEEVEESKEKECADGESTADKEEANAEEDGEDAIDGWQRDSELTCLEKEEVEEGKDKEGGESTIDNEENKGEAKAEEEEQRDSEQTCLEFSEDERDSDDRLSGEEDQKQWKGVAPHPIAARLSQAPTVEALPDAIETKEEEENQYQAYVPVADDISEEEMFLLAEEKELMEFEEIEAEAFASVAAVPVIVEEEEEAGEELQENEEEVRGAMEDIVDQVDEQNRDPMASPTAVLQHTDTETSREASEISDDETIGDDSNRSESDCTLSDASSDTIVTEDGYIVHPDEWDEQDQIQYGIIKYTPLCTIDEEEEEVEEQDIVEQKEDDTNSAVSAPVSSRAADISDDSDEDYRSESEYNNWLTREDKTVREVSKVPRCLTRGRVPSDKEIVPRPSILPVSSWGKGIVIEEEKTTVTAHAETTNGPQSDESSTVRGNTTPVRAPTFLDMIRAKIRQADKANAPSK